MQTTSDAHPATPSAPLVSVIMPAYNAAAFIEAALESALCQTYRHLEIIVVDDGSKDNTAALVETIAKRDSRVCLLRQPNAGVAAARNRAIAASDGEFIAPLDADDLWMPDKIERQVECMRQGGPRVGLVYSWWISIDEENRVLTPGAHWDAQGQVFTALLFCNFIGNASVPLFRRTALEQVGGYNSDLRAQQAQGCEDWELSLRVAEHYEVRCAPGYGCCYRDVADSMAKNCAQMAKSHALVLSEIRRRRPDIAPEIFSWSRGLLLFWLLGLSYNSGNYRGALKWSRHLFRADPVAVTSPWVLQTTFRSLLWSLANPLTRFVWKDRGDYVRYKTGKTPLARLDLSQFNSQNAALAPLPMWNTGEQWHFYDFMCLRRWSALTSKTPGSSRAKLGDVPLPSFEPAEADGWARISTLLKGAR
jgi:GT2 family glycosyltransferase